MMYLAQWNEVNSAPRGGEEMLCVVLRVRSNANADESTRSSSTERLIQGEVRRGTLIHSTDCVQPVWYMRVNTEYWYLHTAGECGRTQSRQYAGQLAGAMMSTARQAKAQRAWI